MPETYRGGKREPFAQLEVPSCGRDVGGTVLATDTWPAITGTTASDIANRSVSFTTSGGPEVGEEIRLVLKDPGGGSQAGIDNISLDATAVATPATPGTLIYGK